jgi:hypothetical protein
MFTCDNTRSPIAFSTVEQPAVDARTAPPPTARALRLVTGSNSELMAEGRIGVAPGSW